MPLPITCLRAGKRDPGKWSPCLGWSPMWSASDAVDSRGQAEVDALLPLAGLLEPSHDSTVAVRSTPLWSPLPVPQPKSYLLPYG